MVIGQNIKVAIDQKKMVGNLILLDSNEVKREILSANNQLENVVIRKSYPHTLVLEVIFKTPVAKLVTHKRNVTVDCHGVIIGLVHNSEKLPSVQINIPDIPDGETISDTSVHSAISFLCHLPTNIRISQITKVDDQTLSAEMGKSSILFDPNSDIGGTVSTLQTLLARFRMKSDMPTRIDLRFDKPVVTY
jgi:hypothetical protein